MIFIQNTLKGAHGLKRLISIAKQAIELVCKKKQKTLNSLFKYFCTAN